MKEENKKLMMVREDERERILSSSDISDANGGRVNINNSNRTTYKGGVTNGETMDITSSNYLPMTIS